MTFLRALATLLRLPGFRRLFVSRITSQGSDGIFQAALASHVLFNPENAADARGIALAFAIVLLPYSLLGPFAGVLLDRWPRRRVLVITQLLRCAAMLGVAAIVTGVGTNAAFYVAVLVVFSLNRFVLAGFSASLTHVVRRDELVQANSVAPPCGSIAYILGAAAGTALRAVSSDAVVVLAAAAGVVGASYAASRLPFVGPDDDEPGPSRPRAVVATVVHGLGEAARTLPRRARVVLALVFFSRLPFGFLLLQTLLLFRGPFAGDGGAMGLQFGLAAVASAVGFSLAAFVTPWLAPKLTAIPYAVSMLAVGGAACLVLGPFLTTWSIIAIGFTVALTSQCVKITADSLMQAHVPDHLLGRAFSIFDMVYNAGLVLAASGGALLLPPSGLAWWPLTALGAAYAVVAFSLRPTWDRASRLDETRPRG